MQIIEWSLKRAANANILNSKCGFIYLSDIVHPMSKWGWGVKPSSNQICPLLSSLKTAGLLLRHQQLDLMSSDLTLRMGSFPAGRRANESPLKSYTNSYLQQLGGQFSAHQFSRSTSTMYLLIWAWTYNRCPISGWKERRLIVWVEKIDIKMSEGGGSRKWGRKSKDILVSSSFFFPFSPAPALPFLFLYCLPFTLPLHTACTVLDNPCIFNSATSSKAVNLFISI